MNTECPDCEYHKSRALRWRDEAYKQAGYPLPEPPPECQTEAEKTAFAFGWFKAMETKRPWVGLMRGVRVEGDTVIITVKGGNDAARELCSELANEMGVRNGA